MPYIGTQPLTGQFKKLDAISVVNGQAAYTLNYNSAAYKPATANALLVSVNGVIQAAGDAYTISGSTITFTENLVTGDVIDFIIALGDTGSAVTPVDGSVTTAKLGDDSVTEAKLANSLDMQNITLKGGTTDALTIDSSGRVLTPANPKFSVHLSTITASTDFSSAAGAVPFDTIDFNIGSCVAISSSVATFTAPITGYYQFNLSVVFEDCESANHVNTYLQKDGAFQADSDLDYRNIEDPQGGSYNTNTTGALIYLTATQTINPMITVNGDTSVKIRDGSRFSGFLVG